MSSTFDFGKKSNSPTGAIPARPSPWDRRASRRCKITQPMRIRPTDSKFEPCNDICTTVSVSQTGVYFRSSVSKYYEVGMRLFLTLPYSNAPADPPHEYLTEVVRRVALPNGLFGIGLKILLEVSPQGEDG